MILDVVPFVHRLLEDTLSKEDITIDATCGNGHDTLKLAMLSKFVYGFDVQDIAVENTTSLLNSKDITNFKVIKDSHANLSKYVSDKVKAVTFNLGYLPGSDKSVQTSFTSTLQALHSCLDILEKNGVICISLYIGHEGGINEAMEVEKFVKPLDRFKYKVVKYDFINKVKAPYVLIIEKQ